MRSFTIELRTDFDDPGKDDLVRDAARVAAKHLYTTAVMISDKRKPEISLHSGDFFESAEEIDLADDIPAEPTGRNDGGADED